MTRFGIGHKFLSVIVMSAIVFISVVGAYPVHASPRSRFHWKMPSLLHTRHVVGPMLVKTLRKNRHKKNGLDLFEQQYQQLKEEFQRFEHNAAQFRREFQVSKQALRSKRVRIGKQPGASAVEHHVYMAKLRFRELFTRHMTAILKILTPGQHAKLRRRGLAMLMISMLGAELHTFLSPPHTEELAKIPSVQIERATEHPPLPEELVGDLAVYEQLKIPLTNILQNQTILRI